VARSSGGSAFPGDCMAADAPQDFKTIAWNGISFRVPQPWEALRLGKNYLMLEDRGRPTMEVKWGAIRGRFSADRQLKRLAAASRKADQPLRGGALPRHWRRAVAAYEVTAFAWADRQVRAEGVLLYCATCGTASMVQFFSPAATEATAAVLASFRDHPGGERVAWQVFDIGFRLAPRYRLDQFRFEPGQYRLVFRAGGEVVTLLRWGPANVLLAGGSLCDFAARRMGGAHRPWREQRDGDIQVLEWHGPRTPLSPWRRVMAPMQVQAARLWHLPRQNRILAVTIEARRPATEGLLEDVCSTYVVV